jgi:DNA-binding winged helix-turn-helix (wHTH) protein
VVYTFGSFVLDETARRLTRDGERVMLPDRQLAILRVLLAQAGAIVPKDALLDTAWPDVAVGDNSLEQAISSLRRALGPTAEAAPYIETLPRRGYRFSAPVIRRAPRQSDEGLDSLLGPLRAFVEGRSALETLGRNGVARACEVLTGVVAESPDLSAGHVGLANALALRFEASRLDDTPDVEGLRAAGFHAREACRLEPENGEGWATLAFVLSRAGATLEATAAGRRAIALEPDNWRHHLRLAYATWGEDRLRAARRTLALVPDLGLAHWLAATVHVARGSLAEAERELIAGTEAQDRQPENGRFGAVGLHLLLGLVRLARGDDARAMTEFERELAFERSGHIYAAEACSNAWGAIGTVYWQRGAEDEAVEAFDRALDLVRSHPYALAAVCHADAGRHRDGAAARLARRLELLRMHGQPFLMAMTEGVAYALAGQHSSAATRVHAALREAPAAGSAGWLLPVEPFVRVGLHPEVWEAALATLASRAA